MYVLILWSKIKNISKGILLFYNLKIFFKLYKYLKYVRKIKLFFLHIYKKTHTCLSILGPFAKWNIFYSQFSISFLKILMKKIMILIINHINL